MDFDNLIGLNSTAKIIGIHPSILKLLFSLALNYLVAFYERYTYCTKHIGRRNASANIDNHTGQMIFHSLITSGVLFWNFGYETKHLLICVAVQYLLIFTLTRINQHRLMLLFSWIFQLGYLMIGYISHSHILEYTIQWTMPGCVLCLRLIMIASDSYDGGKPEAALKPDQKESALKSVPRPLEFYAYTLFYGTLMIGPQFTISHYRKYLAGTYVSKAGTTFWSETRNNAIRKGLLGFCGLGLSSVLASTYSADHMYSDGHFWTRDLLQKILYIHVYGLAIFIKYISTWLFSEGAVIFSGIGTIEESIGRGDSKKLVLHHDAMANVRAFELAKGNDMGVFVRHFNINTNQWVLKYVYKRLAFLGNKQISHISALMFLAIWHGSHLGYYTCFFYEFVIIHVEKQFKDAGIIIEGYNNLFRGILQKVFYWWTLTGYCNIDFTLLKSDLFMPVYQSVYFYGHIYVILMLLASIFVVGPKKKND